jgi:hypothetical protein
MTGSNRRRGAQPGNRNAFKHGFYSSVFKPAERKDLEALVSDGLLDEIDLLRVFMRRVGESAEGIESVDQALPVLRTLGLAAHRIAGLLRAQRDLGEAGDDDAAAVAQALADVVKEMGLKR